MPLATTLPRCNRDGCPVPAQYIVAIRLWAAGHPKTDTTMIKMETGLHVCDLHKLDIHPVSYWFNDEASKKRITEAFKSRGRAVPEFDTAEYEFRRLKA